jgi:hypothetical protein
MKCRPKKIKITEDVNDDELVLSSSRVVLEVNESEKNFYKIMRDIVERMYRRIFHLQYKNQSNDSENRVKHKLQQAFLKQWLMRLMRLAIEKTYNNKKESFKKYYC